MRLEDVDGPDRVSSVAVVVVRLHRLDRVDDHLPEKIAIRADNLRAHARLGRLQDRVLAERLDVRRELRLDVLHRLAHRQTVPADDARRVDLVAHEIVRAAKELAGENHDGRRAVAHLAVLEIRELHENLRVEGSGGVAVSDDETGGGGGGAAGRDLKTRERSES